MNLRWFISTTVRTATDLRKQVQKLLNAQRDILSAEAVASLEAAIAELKSAENSGAGKKALLEAMDKLEKAANNSKTGLKPYPNAGMRENIEVILVALAVALAVRTFFLQPFKIPTGSMQPTLFGITSENLRRQTDFRFPTGWARVGEWFAGISYVHIKAETESVLEDVEPPRKLLLFNLWQRIKINGQWRKIWLPPDLGQKTLQDRAEVGLGQSFHQGEDIIKLKVVSGDHLFVDRLTYNFRKPRRGEIVVFETKGIRHSQVPQDQFYIKRLVGLGGESVRINAEHRLIINEQPLSAATPHFENLYGPNPTPQWENTYVGHYLVSPFQSEYFTDPSQGFLVRSNRFLVMGDNTRSSLDSRYWGDVQQQNIIGRSFFVYWPLNNSRFGWNSLKH